MTWTIEMSDELPYWTPNRRGHWSDRNTPQQMWRTTVGWKAKAADIPQLDRVTVELAFLPGNRRRRDPDNLAYVAKAAIDGLCDAGVLEDDSWRHVAKVSLRIVPTDGKSRWLLRISEQTPLPDCA